MKSIFISLISLLISFTAIAQEVAIGQWRDYLPYREGTNVAVTPDGVYSATPYSLFFYDTEDNSIERYSKINGLSESFISTIRYNDYNNTLLIAYQNTDIDLITPDGIVNIPDIKIYSILGKKTINDIMFIDNLAYLSCGFGIVVLDMDRQEIYDTYYIGPEGKQLDVRSLCVSEDSFYAATEDGIYTAERENPQLAFYENWSKDTTYPYPNDIVSNIVFFENNLFASTGNEDFTHDTIFRRSLNDDKWEAFMPAANYSCYSMGVSENHLLISFSFQVRVINSNLEQEYTIGKPSGRAIYPRDAEMSNKFVWVSNHNSGLVKVSEGGGYGEFIAPNGPYSQKVFSMEYTSAGLWVSSGGHNAQWGNLYQGEGVYHFDGTSWNNYNKTNTPAFDSISDPVVAATNPAQNKTYIGTWGRGIMQFENGKVTNVYYSNNSSLAGMPSWESFVAVGGLAFDIEGNLWAVNTSTTNILSVLKTDGSWQAYNLGGSASNIDVDKLIIDQNNQKWIRMRADHSVLVFDESQPVGNQSKILTSSTGNGNIPGNKVYAIEEDKDGEIWLGTDEGIAVIYSPWNVFRGGSYDAQRIKVEWEGYVQYLLETEVITSICVDGNNQKWIGTDRSGVFLLSADGTEQIHHFTAENSPLFSNAIVDIAINGENGEVYIATDKGIISYKAKATEGGDTNENVYAYPNPVNIGYSGSIAVKGLVENAFVKITDISGNLVYSGRAEGGQAVWNGKTMNGDDVHTGVYLVFITDQEGEETMVTKIMFLK